MIYECRVNLKNKRKDELIMYLEEALQTIQKQESEINKLNNVIDRMAEVLNDFDYDKQCESCRTDICSASVDGTEYTQCIKEYFMKEDK